MRCCVDRWLMGKEKERNEYQFHEQKVEMWPEKHVITITLPEQGKSQSNATIR